MARRWGTAAALLLAVSVAGCLDPFRAYVDDAVLQQAHLDWSRSDQPQTDGGLFGAKTAETDYTLSGSGPPFPAVLQVFSLRTVARPSTQDLLGFVHTAVDNGTDSRGVRIDQAQSAVGQRMLAGGVATQFFTEEGTSTRGGLFPVNTKVRIIGEVGYDGSSSTSVIAVGIAQVESSRTCPLNIDCGVSRDEASWTEMVGDPSGSVGGAVSQTGLIDHLVTHG